MARRAWLRGSVLVLLFLGLLVPSAAAVEFTGPGQRGVVPVGEGGHTIAGLAGIADDRVFVALTGIPADACRLVLDENGTFAPTGITWSPNATTAYVWAEPGARDAPFRLDAVWHLDIKGNCTAEGTEAGTIWHDPDGRPYVELTLEAPRTVHRGEAGGTIPVRFEVRNNGTIDTEVDGRISTIDNGFRVSSPRPTLNVQVGPRSNATFQFDIEVPDTMSSGRYVIQVDFESADGWRNAGNAILEVRPSGTAPTPERDPSRDDPLPPPTVAPEEAPAPAALVVVLLAALVAARRRR